MRKSMRVSLSVCIAAAVFAACSGSSSKSTTSPSINAKPSNVGTTPTTSGGSEAGTPITSDAACKLVTQADATALFGHPATQKTDNVPTQLAKSVCIWSARPTNLLSYLLQVRVWDGPQFFTGNLPGYVSLPGVADKAAIYVLPGGSSILTAYQKGNQVVTISYSVHEIATGNRKKAADQQDQFVALVKQAASR
jgi:hypothetical protein